MHRQHKLQLFQRQKWYSDTLAHRCVQLGFRVHALRLGASTGRLRPFLDSLRRHETRGLAQFDGVVDFLLHLAYVRMRQKGARRRTILNPTASSSELVDSNASRSNSCVSAESCS